MSEELRKEFEEKTGERAMAENYYGTGRHKYLPTYARWIESQLLSAREELASVKQERNRMREALNGLSHRQGECWCDMAIGNPMFRDHTEACKVARAALSAPAEEKLKTCPRCGLAINNTHAHVCPHKSGPTL